MTNNIDASRVICVTILFIITILVGLTHAETKVRTLTKAQIPRGIKIDGKFVTASEWSDKKGDNLVILSASREYVTNDDGDEVKDGQLFVAVFHKYDKVWKTAWNLWDHEDECRWDLTCDFVKNSLEISDLDGNGIAEVSFAYRLNCAGDTSDSNQKLFLVEEGKKYPLRGWVGLIVDEKQVRWTTTDMKIDKAYNSAPAKFRMFAVKKWNTIINQELR